MGHEQKSAKTFDSYLYIPSNTTQKTSEKQSKICQGFPLLQFLKLYFPSRYGSSV